MIPNEYLNVIINEGIDTCQVLLVYSKYSTNTYDKIMQDASNLEKIAFSYDMWLRFEGKAKCKMVLPGPISREVENKDYLCLIPVIDIKTRKGNHIRFFDREEQPIYLSSGSKTVIIIRDNRQN